MRSRMVIFVGWGISPLQILKKFPYSGQPWSISSYQKSTSLIIFRSTKNCHSSTQKLWPNTSPKPRTPTTTCPFSNHPKSQNWLCIKSTQSGASLRMGFSSTVYLCVVGSIMGCLMKGIPRELRSPMRLRIYPPRGANMRILMLRLFFPISPGISLDFLYHSSNNVLTGC